MPPQRPIRTPLSPTDGLGITQPHASTRHGHGRAKRKTVYNACENCRSSKVKCSGHAPCTQCARGNVQCIFTGRYHERVQHDLRVSEQEVAAAREKLAISQQDLAISRHKVLLSQQDLTTSQLTLLQSREEERVSLASLTNVFNLLRASVQQDGTGGGAARDLGLQTAARHSRNIAEFGEALGLLTAARRASAGTEMALAGTSTPEHMNTSYSLQRTGTFAPPSLFEAEEFVSPHLTSGSSATSTTMNFTPYAGFMMQPPTGMMPTLMQQQPQDDQQQVDPGLSIKLSLEDSIEMYGLEHFSLLPEGYGSSENFDDGGREGNKQIGRNDPAPLCLELMDGWEEV